MLLSVWVADTETFRVQPTYIYRLQLTTAYIAHRILLHNGCALPLTMANFIDLATRGHLGAGAPRLSWCSLDGSWRHFIGSRCYTRKYPHDIYQHRGLNPEYDERANASRKKGSLFFPVLLTTVPAVFGQSKSNDSKGLESDLATEIAYTRRCRQLSTYFQIATLASLCRLSWKVAQRYIRLNHKCSWSIHRSIDPLNQLRPMDVWEAQYNGDKSPPELERHSG